MSVDARPLLVVDGDNLAHRAFHALPSSIRGEGGRPLNAVVGWTNLVLGLWDAEQPRAVFVAWDTLGVPTERHRLWPTYQGGRVFDEAIVEQLGVLPDLARALGFGVGQQAGYEADDLMAAAVRAETRAGGACRVVTTDRDIYQLVSDAVTVLVPRGSTRPPDRVDPAAVVARLGVRPDQVVDFKALAGDASDGIPGVRGIGAKGAARLLEQYGDLEGVLATESRKIPPDQADLARLFQRIVTLRDDPPVERPPSGEPDWGGGAAFLRDLGAARLADRLTQRATAIPTVGAAPGGG